MAAAVLLILAIVILCSPLIARETRRIIVSIASELKSLKDEVAAIKAAPVLTPDLTDLDFAKAQIADLIAKVDSLTKLVGTPDELNPPA